MRAYTVATLLLLLVAHASAEDLDVSQPPSRVPLTPTQPVNPRDAFVSGYHAGKAGCATLVEDVKDACGCPKGSGWSTKRAKTCKKNLGCPDCGCATGSRTLSTEAAWCLKYPCIRGPADPYELDTCPSGQRACDEDSVSAWSTAADAMGVTWRKALVSEKSFTKQKCAKPKPATKFRIGGSRVGDVMCPMWSRSRQCVPVLDQFNSKFKKKGGDGMEGERALVKRWCASTARRLSREKDPVGRGCLMDKKQNPKRLFLTETMYKAGDLRLDSSLNSLSESMVGLTCKSKRCFKDGRCKPNCADGKYQSQLLIPNAKMAYFLFTNIMLLALTQLKAVLCFWIKKNVWATAKDWYSPKWGKRMGVSSLQAALKKAKPFPAYDEDFEKKIRFNKKTKAFEQTSARETTKKRTELYKRVLGFYYPDLFTKDLFASKFPITNACVLGKPANGNKFEKCDDRAVEANKRRKKSRSRRKGKMMNLLETEEGEDEKLYRMFEQTHEALSDKNVEEQLISSATSFLSMESELKKPKKKSAKHGTRLKDTAGAGLWRRRRRGKSFVGGMVSSAKNMAKKATNAVKSVVKKGKELAKKGMEIVKSGGKALLIKMILNEGTKFAEAQKMGDLWRIVTMGTKGTSNGPLMKFIKTKGGVTTRLKALAKALFPVFLSGELAKAVSTSIFPKIYKFMASGTPEYRQGRSSLQERMLRGMQILGDQCAVMDRLSSVDEPTLMVSDRSWLNLATPGKDATSDKRVWNVYAIRAPQAWWKATAQLHSQVIGNNKDPNDKKCYVYDEANLHRAKDPKVPCKVDPAVRKTKSDTFSLLTNFKSPMAAANIGFTMSMNESPHVPKWIDSATEDWEFFNPDSQKGKWIKLQTPGAYRWGPKALWKNSKLQGSVKCMAKLGLTFDVCSTCCCRSGGQIRYNVKSSVIIDKDRFCRTWFAATVDPVQRVLLSISASFVNSNILSVPCYEDTWLAQQSAKHRRSLGDTASTGEYEDDSTYAQGGKGRRGGGGFGGNGGAVLSSTGNRAGNSESLEDFD